MKKYDVVVLDEYEQKELFGRELSFLNGFVQEPRLDYEQRLANKFNRPVVSVRPSGRESWNEILVFLAKGYIDDDGMFVLDYKTADELETILADIFMEEENDEYEVFEFFKSTCDTQTWNQVKKWVHETY